MTCFAQSGFNTTYDSGSALWWKAIKYDLVNDQITVAGAGYNDSSSLQQIVVAMLDTSGFLLKLDYISHPAGEFHLAMDDNARILIDSRYSAIIPFGVYGESQFGIIFYNRDGSEEFIRFYELDSASISVPLDLVQMKSGYLVTGRYSKPPNYVAQGFAMKINRSGERIWFKEFGNPAEHTSIRHVEYRSNNLILLGGSKFNDLSGKAVGWVLTMDSTGTIKSEWVADTSELSSGSILCMQFDTLTSDLSYFTFVERPTTNPGQSYTVRAPVYVRRDSLMNLISFEIIEPFAVGAAMESMEANNEADFIVCGNTTLTTDTHISPLNSQQGSIMKLKRSGDIQWIVMDTAFYDAELGSINALHDLTIDPNGYSYMVGEAHQYDDKGVYRGYGWLLKITPDGCVEPLCSTQSIFDQLKEKKMSIQVFPNPAKGYVHLAVNGSEVASYFNLYDRMGIHRLGTRLTTDQKEINLSSVQGGFYVWQICNRNGLTVGQGSLIIKMD
jgi:hypothetical protein